MMYVNKKLLDNKVKYVLCDFDRTISIPSSNTSFGIFRASTRVPNSYTTDSDEYYKYYRKYELDFTIDKEVKKEMMREWAINVTRLFNKYGIDYETYKKIIEEDNSIILRPDFIKFASLLNEYDIPLYIVSAGIADVIKHVLDSNGINFSNIKIISNQMDVCNGRIIGLKEPVLHSANKDVVKGIDEEGTGLLFGDLPLDKLLGTGLDTINIGFLNDDKDLELYKKEFDIVLTDDTSFYDVAKILIKK